MPLSPYYRQSLTTLAIELGLIAAAWIFLKLDEPLVAAIAVAAIASALSPARIRPWVSGIGLIALAALSYFYYGNGLLGLILGVYGLYTLGTAVREVLRK